MSKNERTYPPEVLWLRDRAKTLSIADVEKQIGMGQNSLRPFLRGHFGLNERWWAAVVKWVQKFVEMPGNEGAMPSVEKSSVKLTKKAHRATKSGSAKKPMVKKRAPKTGVIEVAKPFVDQASSAFRKMQSMIVKGEIDQKGVPVRKPGESAIDFAARKNEWKIKNS